MLNSQNATGTPVDPEDTLVIVFHRANSLKTRFTQMSMWASNVARVTVELRQYDDPRFEPALRVTRR